MTKADFKRLIDRVAFGIADGGQLSIDDAQLIDKMLGGVDLYLMSEEARESYIYGVRDGFELGGGYGVWRPLFDDEEGL